MDQGSSRSTFLHYTRILSLVNNKIKYFSKKQIEQKNRKEKPLYLLSALPFKHTPEPVTMKLHYTRLLPLVKYKIPW